MCFSVGSSVSRNYYYYYCFFFFLKKVPLASLWCNLLLFLPLASPPFFSCLTPSAHCLTRDQLDWLLCTHTRVGLIWSKLCTSGWVVVLWPCLCWMSAPCLSWEQPTGIPQIWHAAPHAHRERERKEGKKKKIIQFPKNPGWIHYREINFIKFFFFVFIPKLGTK